MSFTQIYNILNKQVVSKGLAQQISAALLCEEFDKIVIEKWGIEMKNKAKALYCKDKILTVACLSSTMAQEIKLNEGQILDALNKKFNSLVVEKIRYVL